MGVPIHPYYVTILFPKWFVKVRYPYIFYFYLFGFNYSWLL
jgi:hypothetical protein